jgi:hypothetical protein
MTPQKAISSSSILMAAQTPHFLAEVSAIEEVSSCTLAMVGLLPEKEISLVQGSVSYCFLNAEISMSSGSSD